MPDNNDFPGLSSFLSGALHGAAGYVDEERTRNRQLEDAEYDRRRKAMQYLYEGVQQGTVDPYWHAQVVKDIHALDEGQKNPKGAKGVKGFMGGHESPITPLYDLLMQNKVPLTSADPRTHAPASPLDQFKPGPTETSTIPSFAQYIPSMEAEAKQMGDQKAKITAAIPVPQQPFTDHLPPPTPRPLYVDPIEQYRKKLETSADVTFGVREEAADTYRMQAGSSFDPKVYAAILSGKSIPSTTGAGGQTPSKVQSVWVDANGENPIRAKESPDGKGMVNILNNAPLPLNYKPDVDGRWQGVVDDKGIFQWIREGTGTRVSTNVRTFQSIHGLAEWKEVAGTDQEQLVTIDPVSNTAKPVPGVTRTSDAQVRSWNQSRQVSSHAREILDNVRKDIQNSLKGFMLEGQKLEDEVDKQVSLRYPGLDPIALRTAIANAEKTAEGIAFKIPPPPLPAPPAPAVTAAAPKSGDAYMGEVREINGQLYGKVGNVTTPLTQTPDGHYVIK